MPDATEKSGTDVAGAIERLKRHPVIAVTLALVALVSFTLTVTDQFTRIRGWFAVEPNPLASLELDSRPAFLEQHFGVAKRAVDLCKEIACPGNAPDNLRMYVHETNGITLRAVFQGESLELYAVTVNRADVTPEMKWLGHDLGHLGKATFSEILNRAKATTPTDTALFMGARSVAYAEVFAPGAPGHYRGLLLAWAPDGYGGQGMRFDLDSAHELREGNAAALARFRSGTTPNTFGEFRDDGGYVGEMVTDADQLIKLLSA